MTNFTAIILFLLILAFVKQASLNLTISKSNISSVNHVSRNLKYQSISSAHFSNDDPSLCDIISNGKSGILKLKFNSKYCISL